MDTAKLVILSIVFVLGTSLLSASIVSGDTLQEWFDANEYDVDVENDELGIEMFPPGHCQVTILNGEHAFPNPTGWYVAECVCYQLFPGGPEIGDAESFTSHKPFGFYIKSNQGKFCTEKELNPDDFDHALTFYNTKGPGYVVAFEDVLGGGDQDYTDRIIEVVIAPTGHVIPEYPLGTILGVAMCFAALAALKSERIRLHP